MKQIVVILGALIAGFVGGVFGTLATRTRESPIPIQSIRARRFELVNERGQVISFWGAGENDGVILAFGKRPSAEGNAADSTLASLVDSVNQLQAIGILGDDTPFLRMRALDKKQRLSITLSTDGKPTLLMGDAIGTRLSLGLEHSDTPGPQDNDWSLAFVPDVARIGLHSQKENGQAYVRGVFVHTEKVKYP